MLADFLVHIFWDIDLSQVDLNKHSGFIISRILEKGNYQQLNWMTTHYSRQSISSVIKNSANLSTATINLWKLLLNDD